MATTAAADPTAAVLLRLRRSDGRHIAALRHPGASDGGVAAGLAALAVRSPWETAIAGVLLACGAAYVVAVARLWRRAGRGRGIRYWEAAAFAGAWVTLFVALVSPLAVASEVLFAAHMTQHELLMLVAAPLLVVGRPLLALVWLLPERRRTGIAVAQRHGASLSGAP